VILPLPPDPFKSAKLIPSALAICFARGAAEILPPVLVVAFAYTTSSTGSVEVTFLVAS